LMVFVAAVAVARSYLVVSLGIMLFITYEVKD